METEKVVEILKKCELFTEFSEKELRAIADVGHIERFEAGETIYKQGSLGKKLYVLSEGQVSLERQVDLDDNRKAKVTVFVLRERPHRRLMGGWSALVGAQHIQMCSAVCDKPAKVVTMLCSDLKEVMNENAAIRIKILEKLILLLQKRIDSSYGAFETI